MSTAPTFAVRPSPFRQSMSAAVAALSAVPRQPARLRDLDDDALLSLTRVAAEEVRLAQLHVSLLAGEIARRSAPELGSTGLAQRTGHRTPDELVRVTTGTRSTDARSAVRIGTSVAADTPTALGTAVLDGRVSVAVADAITVGLGRVGGGVDAGTLDTAAATLMTRVEGLDPDRAGREARAMRDELDLAGIATREEERREQRSFRIGKRANGMGYAHWELDPETFAVVSDLYDRVTSPRRRVPSFEDGDAACADGTGAGPSPTSHPSTGAPNSTNSTTSPISTAFHTDSGTGSAGANVHAGIVPADERTPEQYASDMFAELLRQGAAADTSGLLGDGPAAVRIIVAASTLEKRRGRGWFEGQHDAVSVETIERHACTGGTITMTVDDDGQPLNLGREKRLFSRAQRIALAARDGGCRWPGCERPPSWCEAHHVKHWQRDQGRTDIHDGILLCRHHHLLAHNNGWEIERAGPTYLLTPPGGATAGRTPGDNTSTDTPAATRIAMPSKSRALHDALSA